MLFSVSVFGQSHYTQTVRGRIIDNESQSPIPGVTVLIAGSEPQIVSVTDAAGDFRLENVPIGRITIHAMFITYNFTIGGTVPIRLQKVGTTCYTRKGRYCQATSSC